MAKGGGGAGSGQYLAVAFTDVNGNDKFDGKDKLIAGLVDTNKDHTASVGDTVTWGTYPHLSGNEAGAYLADDATVIAVLGTPNSASVVVQVGHINQFGAVESDGFINWLDGPNVEQ